MIEISATTAEDFSEIHNKLSELPDIIYDQISKASSRSLLGKIIVCEIRDEFKRPQDIYLPNDVNGIFDNGEYIYIHSKHFMFEILGSLYKSKQFNYKFIDIPK